MSWKKVLKEFRSSTELIDDIQTELRKIQFEMNDMGNVVKNMKYAAEKADYGITYEQEFHEFKEMVKSGELKGHSLAEMILEKLQ